MKKGKKFFTILSAVLLCTASVVTIKANAFGFHSAYLGFKHTGIDMNRGVGEADGGYQKVIAGMLNLTSGSYIEASGNNTFMATEWIASSATPGAGTFVFMNNGSYIQVNY